MFAYVTRALSATIHILTRIALYSFLLSLILDFRQYKRIKRTSGCFFFYLRDRVSCFSDLIDSANKSNELYNKIKRVLA
jgi:uncharacterized PurR-regulated membrane protein YhhQ (DUF165 family)